MAVYVLVKTFYKTRNVVPSHGQSCGIGVSAEVDEQVAATLNGRIDVETHDAASRTCGEIAIAGNDNGGSEVNFGKS